MHEALQAENDAREARDQLQKLYDDAVAEASLSVPGFGEILTVPRK
jgi:hypothetical protein